MATGTKTAASRSLDFSLGSDILDRVKDAGRTTGKDRFNAGKTIGDSVKQIGAGISAIAKAKEAEAQKREEDINAWEEGFENAESRNSWASDGLFGKFQDLENNKYKKEYLEAVESGDQQQAQKLLKQMEGRSNKLQSWKTSIENAQQMYKDGNWDFANMTDEEKSIVNIMNNQNEGDYDIEWDDKGNMVFNIDGKKIDLKKYNDIVARSIKPVAVQNAFLKIQDQYVASGEDLKSDFDPARVKQEIKAGNMINRDNLRSIMYNSIDGGGTFAEDMREHPEMVAISYQMLSSESRAQYDVNNDGEISQEEFTALSDEDKDVVVKALMEPENYELAEDLVAQWMTDKTQANWDKGRTKRTENPNLYGKQGGKFNA